MIVMVFIWGVHYIVVKDALDTMPPLAFNAIRFVLGAPLLLAAVLRQPNRRRIARSDMPRLVLLGLLGPLGFQVCFILAIDLTTSTNTALLNATSPLWTALLSLAVGTLVLRRQTIAGLVLSLAGVSLVILGQSDTGIALSRSDLLGSALALGAAMLAATYNIGARPMAERYGGPVVAAWAYMVTMAGLWIAAAPDLARLSPGDVPPRIWPHLLVSGLLSSGAGFLVEIYAIHKLGPTRAASYSNFTPLVAAAAGVLVLGDPLTALLVVGVLLTLWGVLVVRRHTYLRPARGA